MIQSEKKTIMNGGSSSINIDDWARWHDIDVQEIVTLQDYCYELDSHSLYLKAVDSILPEPEERKCSLKYLNLYGIILCRIASEGDADKLQSFMHYSVEAYLHRYIMDEKVNLNILHTTDVLYRITMNYFSLIVEEINQIMLMGYVWEIIKEICDFFKSYKEYESLKKCICSK